MKEQPDNEKADHDDEDRDNFFNPVTRWQPPKALVRQAYGLSNCGNAPLSMIPGIGVGIGVLAIKAMATPSTKAEMLLSLVFPLHQWDLAEA